MELPEHPDRLAPALERFLEAQGWSELTAHQKLDLAHRAFDVFFQLKENLSTEGGLAEEYVRETIQAEEESFFRSLPQKEEIAEKKEDLAQKLSIIHRMPAFQNATPWTQHLLAVISENRAFVPEKRVFSEFQTVLGLYLIPGKVNCSAFGLSLPLTEIRELHGDACLSPLLTQASYNLDVREPTQGLFIPKERLIELIPSNPELRNLLELATHKRHFNDTKQLTQSLAQQTEQGRLLQQILNNLGQASFSINEKGEIGHNYSAEAKTIFQEENLVGIAFADLILRDNRKGLRAYYRALNMVFSGNQFDPIVVLDLLPKTAKINERSFRLSYHFAEDRLGFVVSVFVQMSDVTHEIARAQQAEKTLAKEQQEKQIQEKVRANIASFLSLLEMIDQNRAQLKPQINLAEQGEDLQVESKRTLLKQLHSIKGLCSQFDLNNLRTAVHDLEGVLGGSEEDQDEGFLSSHKRLERQYKYAHSLIDSLGEKIVNVLMGVTFTQKEFSQLKQNLLADNITAARMLIFKKAQLPAVELVSNWAEDIQLLSHTLGKEVQFTFNAPKKDRLPDELVKVLNVELRHVYRNALAHGIESPESRQEAGKPRVGNLACNLTVQGNQIFIELIDDGAGINWETIKTKALENRRLNSDEVQGLIDQNEVWRILFLPGFSSQDQVSEISGRGVGMDAVAQAISQFNGDFGVSTTLGQGTRFWFRLPINF